MKDKVLIAEDDLENGLAALMAMDELGLEAEVVVNADEAIRKIETESYLAVLTDMNMPLKNGEGINPKAGEAVVSACAKKMIPCFVVTAGILNHGGIHDVVDILFSFSSYVYSTADIKFDWQYQLLDRRKKDVGIWRDVWKTIKDNFKHVLSARRRYIKYVLTQ